MSSTAAAILYFNKPAMTARCVASVRQALQAAGRADARILLVDNGSTTAFEAEGCEQVRLWPNQGFGRGMNAALKSAFARPETRLVALLSNDVELGEDFFLECAQLPTDRAAIYCPHVYYLVDKSRPSYTHASFDMASGELAHHFDETLPAITFPFYYPAAVTLWTRAAYERLGGFDERYFCYWEDVELSHRSARLGARLVPAPRLRVHHLGRGTTGGKRAYSEHFRAGRKLTMDILQKSDQWLKMREAKGPDERQVD